MQHLEMMSPITLQKRPFNRTIPKILGTLYNRKYYNIKVWTHDSCKYLTKDTLNKSTHDCLEYPSR